MSRHTWPIRGHAGGFSLVELLVTIIIAGIAFAALVPLFVQAAGKNSADEMRNVALNIAQEKIEMIRELDWTSIVADQADPGTTPNLYNPAFHGGDFGPTWSTARGRTFNIDYAVEDVPNPDVAGQTAYKAVTVTVSWQPPPAPAKAVRLTTFVYRQYQGAKVTSLKASPLVMDWGVPIGQLPASLPSTVSDPFWPGYINGAVTLTAETDAPAEMVSFYAYSGDGAEITGQLQVLATSTSQTTFATPPWTPPAGRDGWYFFTAVATAAGYSGNTLQQSYYVETGPPLAPTDLTAIPGDGMTVLKWTRPAAADLDHYRVYRGTTVATMTLLSDDVGTEGYADSTVTNGATYYYRVSAVDILGKESSLSLPASVVPNAPADTVPPTPPSNLSAATAGSTVTLSWNAASDNVGLGGYFIYRDKDLDTEIGRVDAGALSFTDLDAGFSTPHTYTVLAYDTSARFSSLATLAVGASSDDGWLQITTPAQVYCALIVTTNQNLVSVTARNLKTGQMYLASAKAMKNKPAIFNSPKLPSGTYAVTATWGAVSTTESVDVFNDPTSTGIDF